MKQVIIVKTGEGYSDAEYTFEKEADAIAFFQAIGKAKRVTRDYVTSGIGSLYSETNEPSKATLTYGSFVTKDELKTIKDREADQLLKIEKKKAEEAAKAAALEKVPSDEDFKEILQEVKSWSGSE